MYCSDRVVLDSRNCNRLETDLKKDSWIVGEEDAAELVLVAFLLWLALEGWPRDCEVAADFDDGELVGFDAGDDLGGVMEDPGVDGFVGCWVEFVVFAAVLFSLDIGAVEVDDVDESTGTLAGDTEAVIEVTMEAAEETVGPAAAASPTSLVLGAGSTREAVPLRPSTGGDASTVSVVVGVPSPHVSRGTLVKIGEYHGDSPYARMDTFGVTEAGCSWTCVTSGAGGGISSWTISCSGTASGPVIVSAGSSSSAPASASFHESSILVP